MWRVKHEVSIRSRSEGESHYGIINSFSQTIDDLYHLPDSVLFARTVQIAAN